MGNLGRYSEVRDFCFLAEREDGRRGFAVPPLDQLRSYGAGGGTDEGSFK